MLSVPKGMETTNSTWSQRQRGQAPEGEVMNRERSYRQTIASGSLAHLIHAETDPSPKQNAICPGLARGLCCYTCRLSPFLCLVRVLTKSTKTLWRWVRSLFTSHYLHGSEIAALWWLLLLVHVHAGRGSLIFPAHRSIPAKSCLLQLMKHLLLQVSFRHSLLHEAKRGT